VYGYDSVLLFLQGGVCSMLALVKKTSLIGLIVCGFGLSTYAKESSASKGSETKGKPPFSYYKSSNLSGGEVSVWQVPDIKGKPPTFYYDASKSSKKASFFKPNQIVLVLAKQKEWAKISALDNSGQVAWVPLSEVEQLHTLNIVFNKSPNTYQYQVSLAGPEGGKSGQWYVVQQFSDASFGKEALQGFEQAFLEYEDAWAKHHQMMMKLMMRPFLSGEGEGSEKKKQAPVAMQDGTNRSDSKKVTKTEKKESVVITQEGAS
jgi:hypothetical protein